MSLSPDQLRQRVATAVAALGDPWHESVYPYELFGREPESELHGAFAVGVPSARGSDARSVGRRAADEVVTETTVHLLWAYRIRPDDQRVSVDEALALEASVLKAVAEMSMSGVSGVAWESVDRDVARVGPEGSMEPYLVTFAVWTFRHTYAVQRA